MSKKTEKERGEGKRGCAIKMSKCKNARRYCHVVLLGFETPGVSYQAFKKVTVMPPP